MPVLPLDQPEPFAATLGVMLYPGEDDADRRKAAAYAAQYLADPLRRFHEGGGTLDYDSLRINAEGAGERLDDLEKRWWDATATGQLLKVFFALANTNPELASWSNAIRVAEKIIARQREKGSRSSLMAARSLFGAVAHLWGAWAIREGQFSPRPDVGYDGFDDFKSFLAEAEILRKWGQSWRHNRAKAEPPLPPEVWRVPKDWEPPDRRPGWPETGKVPALTLPEDLVKDLKPAGRPKK